MTYIWIFVGSYLVALAVIVTHFKRKNDLYAARLRENAVSSEQIANFHKIVTTKSILPLAWATFCFGSAAGGVISGIYWTVK